MDLSFLKQSEVKAFIKANEQTDVQKLLLNPPTEFKNHIGLIADQILSRRKAKSKLPEWYANHDLIMPPPLSLEQCSSPATGTYKSNIFSGETLVDLTGGMGIDTLYLSDQFKEVHHVERNHQIHEVFVHNLQALQKTNVQAHHTNAEDFFGQFDQKAYFFIDPARRSESKSRVFLFEDCSPNVIELLPLFHQKAEKVLIKAAPMIDVSLAISQLENVSEVHVVSVRNEVKEVLFLLDYQNQTDNEPMIKCINLDTDQSEFCFLTSEEKSIKSEYSEMKNYLFDPNASILKAGAFKLTGNRYQLNKIAVNTHFYTSEQFRENFPGRVFEIIEKDINKKNISKSVPNGKVNVLTKNYPQKPDEIKKKLKVKDGGELYLIGFKDHVNKPQFVLAKRV